MSSTTGLLSAAAVLAGCLAAEAQTARYNPEELPAFHGRVETFTLTPRGDIDGLVLDDGTEVKTPPHLSTEIALTLRPGDSVTVHGLKAAKLPLVQALSLTNDLDGRTVMDDGPAPPPGAAAKTARRAVEGRVRMALHGARGEINGALLDNGIVLRLTPPQAQRFAALLAPGERLAAEGVARTTGAGTVVEATALGAARDALRPLD